MNDVVLNKKESVERCIRQVRAYYARETTLPFKEDFFTQDAIAINLQRACEQVIDLANYTVRQRQIGLPKQSRDSFNLLAKHEIIPSSLAERLLKMVGFRNILVHEYQELDLDLMIEIIETHIDDFVEFTNYILQAVE